jgi:hypothetical protein
MKTRSTEQGAQRLPVPRTFLERTVHDLNDHVQGCVSLLVFNLEEVGISGWEDRNAKRVVVPAAMLNQTINPGISRDVKRISVIACVSTGGESLIPSIMTLQNSSSSQEHLEKQGMRFGKDMTLKSNQKPDIHADIFLNLRGLGAFADEVALILMDNFSAS